MNDVLKARPCLTDAPTVRCEPPPDGCDGEPQCTTSSPGVGFVTDCVRSGGRWTGIMSNEANEFGREVAMRLLQAPDDEWPSFFDHLRRSHKLTGAVRQLNDMLHHPTDCQLAADALRRIGLLHTDS